MAGRQPVPEVVRPETKHPQFGTDSETGRKATNDNVYH